MSESSKQSWGWGRGMAAIATATALLVLLAFVSLASAAYDPLGSGTTKLTLEKSFLAFLKADRVTLSATAPARLRAGAFTLPVSGGEIDPTIGKGTIEQVGALLFKSARKKVPLKSFVVKTKHSPLIAKVGGSQLKVATSSKLTFAREGFGTDFSTKKLKLSAKVAERLNKKLRPNTLFSAGQVIGSTASRTQPQTITILATDKATLAPNPQTFAKLHERFVSVSPIFPAEAGGGLFTFPIIPGGAIAPNAAMGTLKTGGSMEFLQLGGGQVFLHEFSLNLGEASASVEVDVEPSPPYAGKHPPAAALSLNMGVATVSSDPSARTITLSGATATFSPSLATSFNEAFAKGEAVFKAGEALGTFSFTVQGQ